MTGGSGDSRHGWDDGTRKRTDDCSGREKLLRPRHALTERQEARRRGSCTRAPSWRRAAASTRCRCGRDRGVVPGRPRHAVPLFPEQGAPAGRHHAGPAPATCTPRSASARRPPPRRAKGRRVQLTRAFRALQREPHLADRDGARPDVRGPQRQPEVDQALPADDGDHPGRDGTGRRRPSGSPCVRVIEHTRALGPRSPLSGRHRSHRLKIDIETVCRSDRLLTAPRIGKESPPAIEERGPGRSSRERAHRRSVCVNLRRKTTSNRPPAPA